jgi:hypothetical protein
MSKARQLLKEGTTLVGVFGLTKPPKGGGNNEPRVFPYGSNLHESFTKLLDTRENYIEFVNHYKDLIFEIEDEIIDARIGLASLMTYGDPHFVRPYLQQRAKLLGNLAHKLYYIRTNARSWRREINELLADSFLIKEAVS